MELTALDTTGFLYDPKSEDSYMQLERYEEFAITLQKPPKKKVIQYIILMYDTGNEDLRMEYPWYPQRKLEISRMVGLTKPNLKATDEIEDMLIGKIPEVNRMIVRYLTLFDNPDLMMLASYQEIYTTLSIKSFSGAYDSKTISSLKIVNEDIKILSETVFHGKEETELRAELYKTMEEQKLGIRVEEIAAKLEKGESIFPKENPYGEDYEMEPLKFAGDR